MLDEVTFVIRLLDDNWADAATETNGVNTYGDPTPGLANHRGKPNIIDVRSIQPGQGRRYDADQKEVIVVFEDSASLTLPTIDWSIRNEDYAFTLHLRVLQQKQWTSLTYGRDRLQSLYQIARYILEKKGLRPAVYDANNNIEGSAELIQITGRSEANDRGKRLLGYKMSVTMKRFGRTTVC
jgi:hypothetical protein